MSQVVPGTKIRLSWDEEAIQSVRWELQDGKLNTLNVSEAHVGYWLERNAGIGILCRSPGRATILNSRGEKDGRNIIGS